ncbi:hypothetical protein DFO56_105197 [Kosakonia sp. AG348]|nr:hypothetical protein DFO56_105197 [Kosakonia sp. AG348]
MTKPDKSINRDHCLTGIIGKKETVQSASIGLIYVARRNVILLMM